MAEACVLQRIPSFFQAKIVFDLWSNFAFKVKIDYKLQILIFIHIMSLETYPIQGLVT